MHKTGTGPGRAGRLRAWAVFAVAIMGLPIVARPALAGPPFATDDPEPAEFEHFEINIAAIGTFTEGGRQDALPNIDVNYGAAEDLQLHLGVQGSFSRGRSHAPRYGYGDTELGVKYRFLEEDDEGWQPQISIYPNLEIPTGSRTKEFGTGEVRAFLPVWLQKSFGPWTSFGGGGYWVNPPNGITDEKNYWFAGWALLRRLDDEWSLGGEIFWQSPNGEQAQTGAGFNLGGEYDIDESHHILFSAGRGLEDPTRYNAFSFYLGLQLIL
jgi:hypothetical protein